MQFASFSFRVGRKCFRVPTGQNTNSSIVSRAVISFIPSFFLSFFLFRYSFIYFVAVVLFFVFSYIFLNRWFTRRAISFTLPTTYCCVCLTLLICWRNVPFLSEAIATIVPIGWENHTRLIGGSCRHKSKKDAQYVIFLRDKAFLICFLSFVDRIWFLLLLLLLFCLIYFLVLISSFLRARVCVCVCVIPSLPTFVCLIFGLATSLLSLKWLNESSSRAPSISFSRKAILAAFNYSILFETRLKSCTIDFFPGREISK